MIFKTQPFKHQLDALQITRNKEFAALLMETGTGKTKVAIDTAANLYNEKKINGLLIVAPKTICRNWSEKEIPSHLPDEIKRKTVIWGPKNGRFEKELSALYHNSFDRLSIFIVNVETINGDRCFDECEKFLKAKACLMVIDESTTIKNFKAVRTKSCIALGKLAKYRRIMTGTPATENPMAYFTQFEFLKKGSLGSNSYYGFRNTYGVLKKRYVNGRSFDEIIGYQRLNELKDRITQHSYRVLKKECLDLPDKIYEIRYIDPSTEQQRVYELIRSETMALLRNGDLVLAPLMITQILRMRQALCNLTSAEGKEQPIDDKYPRIEEIIKIVDESGGQQVLIWATFIKNIKDIAEALPGSRVIYGDVKADERQQAVAEFQEGKFKVLVMQPRTGGYGLTLTAATLVIYHDNDWSLESRIQSEDRCHRIGQKNAVTYIDLVTPNTIDEKIRNALVKKRELADIVTGDNLRNMLMES